MAITRVSNRKVYSFRSSGESVELASKLANEDVRLPPVGIKTPVSLADDGKSITMVVHDNIEGLIGKTFKIPDGTLQNVFRVPNNS